MGTTKFYINKVLAQIIYDMIVELLILLNQNHTNCILRRGHINQEITAIVWWSKHGGCCQGFLKSIERLLGSLIPVKRVWLFNRCMKPLVKLEKLTTNLCKKFAIPCKHWRCRMLCGGDNWSIASTFKGSNLIPSLHLWGFKRTW